MARIWRPRGRCARGCTEADVILFKACALSEPLIQFGIHVAFEEGVESCQALQRQVHGICEQAAVSVIVVLQKALLGVFVFIADDSS
jgi:hypothetical protein